jgi:hypothetical protein
MQRHLGPAHPRKLLLGAIIVPIQVWLTVLAWRDLSRRTRSEVRGNKSIWRAFVAINPGNAIIYWLVGRR